MGFSRNMCVGVSPLQVEKEPIFGRACGIEK